MKPFNPEHSPNINHDCQNYKPENCRNILIGDNVTLGNRLTIGPMVAIENGAVIGDDVSFEGDTIIGNNTNIGDRSRIYRFVIVSDNCNVGHDSIINEFSQIPKNTEILAGGIVCPDPLDEKKIVIKYPPKKPDQEYSY